MKNDFMGVCNAFIETINERYVEDESKDRAIVVLAAEKDTMSKIVKGNGLILLKSLIDLFSDEDMDDLWEAVCSEILARKMGDIMRKMGEDD